MKLDRNAFIEVVKNTPLASIDLIVRNTQNKVLLGLRNNEPARNYWFVPGSRICKNERIAQAFRRLSLEELGIELTVQDSQFLGVYEHFYRENFACEPGIETHYVVLAYEIMLNGPLRDLPKDQHSCFRWWPVDNLLQAQDVHPYTKAYFQHIV